MDSWATYRPLREEFPLVFGLAKNKINKVQQNYVKNQGGVLWDWSWTRLPNCAEENDEWDLLKSLLQQQNVGQNIDVWNWKDNITDGYSVKDVRRDVAGFMDVNAEPNNFEWSKIATAKVNLFTWRAAEDRIPTLVALKKRGLQIGANICKVCGLAAESADHIVIQCPVAKEVWLLLWSWVKIPMRDHSESMNRRFNERSGWPRKKEKIIYAIHLLAAWSLWKNRNNKVYNDKTTVPVKLVEEIKEESFEWINLRTRRIRITWNEWRSFSISE
ncbi:uncharacterized protein LOC110914089 [Helianthus annuus]|uniref:uncharacterized protein LOC110914089 n=1 Tax=Helianthus annuus TaxID=4232 RepID=UPI000B8F27A0|nr:uncharacterized protein LOC110914089 [Helianthus annuus]